MNNKLVKASIAGAAAIALAAGGSTFAAWSDFHEEATEAGAGILKLNVSTREGSTVGIKPFSLAPGQNKFQEFYLASADAENVPAGNLTAMIQNLSGSEDGPACTTNSEAVAEGSAESPIDLSVCSGSGELQDEAVVQILTSTPVDGPESCGNSAAHEGVPYISTTPSGVGTLANRTDVPFDLGRLDPGEGVCVRMEMSLPFSTATNASQGDQVDFEWRFDLEQVAPSA